MWNGSPSVPRPRIAPCQMVCSYSATNVSGHHVDTAVPEFIADLVSGLLIEVPIDLVATTTIDGRGMMGDLLIAFACIGRP